VAGSVAEVARSCETVITMLPSTPHVEGTFLGANGLLAHAQRGGMYIDCSTIDPVASKVLTIPTSQLKGSAAAWHDSLFFFAHQSLSASPNALCFIL
jgi:3-hydroxyisobutyrate dehydrogenase-like beta-hydroxyacid dehydrogenase